MRQDDDKRRTDDIAADIERTRGRIDGTLSAIEHRLAPGQLFEQGIDYLRHSNAREFATNLSRDVRDNPLPAALVGIGLAWLMLSGRNGTRAREATGILDDDVEYDEDGATPSVARRAADRAHDLRERAGDSMRDAKRKAAELRYRAGDRVRAVRERAEDLSDAARYQVDRARGGYDRMLREQPLALGAIGLAVGAIAAAAAPRTRTEDRLMGRASDGVAEGVLEATRDQMDSAERTLDALREETFGNDEPRARGEPSGPGDATRPIADDDRGEVAALVQPRRPF